MAGEASMRAAPVSGFPAGGIPGEGLGLEIDAGELVPVLPIRLDFPCCCEAWQGVLGPPLPTDMGPVAGEGALM